MQVERRPKVPLVTIQISEGLLNAFGNCIYIMTYFIFFLKNTFIHFCAFSGSKQLFFFLI